MKKTLWLSAIAVAAFGLVAARQQAIKPQEAARLAAQARPVATYRVTFGEKDTAGKTWDGAIEVPGGEVASLTGWRFGPNDSIDGTRGWKLATRVANMEDQRRGTTVVGQPAIQRLVEAGIVVAVRAAPGSSIRVSTAQGNFEFSDVAYGRPAAFLEGNVTVERVPETARLTDTGYEDDFPSATVSRDGTLWIAWLGYRDKADSVLVARRGEAPQVISGPGDHQQPAIVEDPAGRVWIVWSQFLDGAWHLRARRLENGRWTAVEQVTSGEGPNLSPVIVADSSGDLCVVWQGFRNRRGQILLKTFRQGRWSNEVTLSEGPGDHWHAAIAADSSGGVWIAWDGYSTGAYQIYARRYAEGRPGALHHVSRNNRFAARPSIAWLGAPWIAWEDSAPHWGKDWAVDDPAANKLYTDRSVRVAFLQGSQWREVTPPVRDTISDRMRRFHQGPRIAFDGVGRLWMIFRVRTSTVNSREDNWASAGRWEFYLTRWDGSRWIPAIWLPDSAGRNGMRAHLVAGPRMTVSAIWPTDNRNFPQGRPEIHDLYAASFSTLPGGIPPPPSRAIVDQTAGAAPSPHPREADDLRRIRDYRLTLGGKIYRIYRADFHRHTEFSGDGAGDGSLEDLYRYEMNAADLDIGHVGDHQMGIDIEYYWWLTQKSNDMYHLPGRFVNLYGYERSVNYPNGHRNIVWAERGHPVLRIEPGEAKGGASSGPILYPYLKATRGITMMHTSATQQGSDWRDNDPEVEPLVEIYQGFESNYEHEGAPRSWDPKRSKPVHQGQRPDGFVWNAWAKGYKLGVQSSSDHIATHTSYANVVAEDFTRQGLVDAMRRRHTYASTDLIILDYRIDDPSTGPHLMGDIFATKTIPKIVVKVIGTAPIKKVDVIKNNKFVFTRSPNAREFSFDFVDNEVTPGESYYYVRVEQSDGELAWSSPIWVTYQR